MNAPLTEAEAILALAGERGLRKSLPYAGEVTPEEAFRLYSAANAKIVDVRSRFEHQHIGRVPGSSLIVWKHWPGGEFNARFLPELRDRCATGDIVLFLCRSGVRSHSAAAVAAAAGYTQAFNILEGFEGDLNEHGQRGHLGGWRKAGLPWRQC
ncbi:MAG: rhodanese-like domain-containing protein [Betaproteobacteria bacterium]